MSHHRLFAKWLEAFEQHKAIARLGTNSRLRLEFLIPFIGASIVLLGIWSTMFYVSGQHMVDGQISQTQTLIRKMYVDNIVDNTRLFKAVMAMLQKNTALHTALAHRDRAELQRLATPLYKELNHRFGISHFYFSDPHRVNILRVHEPDRYGDIINRHTTLEAERTGKTSSGVDLGTLGTFTLRVVTPWYADNTRQHLIGYVELGVGIDRVLKSVRTFTGVPLYILISKKFLKRKDWETGMRMLGNTPDWNRFPGAVLSAQTSGGEMPAALVRHLKKESVLPLGEEAIDIEQDQTGYRAIFEPLTDATGRSVGQMVSLIDVSPHLVTSRRLTYIGIIVGTVVVGLLTGFFYILSDNIGQRIQQDERKLRQLATHDGLTGLYNHRRFLSLLEDELARAHRFKHPVSLLMLDIDHFKKVNDTYGHQAGDAILKGLSNRLKRQARAIDRVCRYGGEEITILLPETDLETAANIAERIRAVVEAQPFKAQEDPPIPVTVSIGVATWPTHASDSSKLISAADTAMYEAKHRGRNRVHCANQAAEKPIEEQSS